MCTLPREGILCLHNSGILSDYTSNVGQRFECGTALFMCMNGTIRPHYTNAF